MPRVTPPPGGGYCVLTPEVQRLSAEIKTEARAARAKRRLPPCGCTLHTRCTEAHQLRAVHQEAWEAHDTTAITAARQQYSAHLRRAGVTPGQARWEEER